jgi:hypothetical protein
MYVYVCLFVSIYVTVCVCTYVRTNACLLTAREGIHQFTADLVRLYLEIRKKHFRTLKSLRVPLLHVSLRWSFRN